MPRIATHIVGTTPDTSGTAAPLPVGVIYNTDDPYMLRFDFQVSTEEYLTWIISIELLSSPSPTPATSSGTTPSSCSATS